MPNYFFNIGDLVTMFNQLPLGLTNITSLEFTAHTPADVYTVIIKTDAVSLYPVGEPDSALNRSYGPHQDYLTIDAALDSILREVAEDENDEAKLSN